MNEPFRISRLVSDRKGQIGLCRLPGSISSLKSDVEAICNFGADHVLSLTPAEEMHAKGAASLPMLLAQRGIVWHHFPIVDYSTPLPEQEQAWNSLSAQMHGALDDGRTVVIHCYAGIGRTGMVTMRLMVERGVPPKDALSRIRAVRPGAVERPAQYDWAAGKSSR